MIHQALEGRLLLIHLLCKHNARRISAPCIALRIAGSPGKIFIKFDLLQCHLSYMGILVILLFKILLWRMNPMTWKDWQFNEREDIFTYRQKVFHFLQGVIYLRSEALLYKISLHITIEPPWKIQICITCTAWLSGWMMITKQREKCGAVKRSNYCSYKREWKHPDCNKECNDFF